MKSRVPVWILGATLLPGAGGCGPAEPEPGPPPPPSLQVTPASITHTVRLGDEAGAAVPARADTVQLRSSDSRQSIGWTLDGTSTWAVPSTTRGGTPADLKLEFDVASMEYGVNESVFRIRHGDATTEFPVRYELLGALDIAPSRSVTLHGVDGEERSGTATLELGSSVKPGLAWRAATETSWLVVEPKSGVTPAKVTISAKLAEAASHASGSIVFSADSAWRGSPSSVSVVVEILKPEAIRAQIDAKIALMKSDRDAMGADLKRMMAGAQNPKDLDEIVDTYREMTDRAESAAKRLRTQRQDLAGFLDQNEAYEKHIRFDTVRSSADDLVAEVDKAAKRLRSTLDGMTKTEVEVSARAEWQAVAEGLEVGDTVLFQASGQWTLGAFAGRADATGLADPAKHARLSVDPDHAHGCLLLRRGSASIAARSLGFLRITEAGKLEARCNDKKYTDNRGSLALRIVVLKRPAD